jgi:hypothetical protein
MPTTVASSLIAIVEVPYDQRVRCCAQGCGHSVYKRVHIVQHEGVFSVFGSDCFAKLFGGTDWARRLPHYGSGEGRLLTPEERALLVENTERLIQQFQLEAEEDARRKADLEMQFQSHSATKGAAARIAPSDKLSPAQQSMSRTEAETIARTKLSRDFPGIDLNMPGWSGLLELEVQRIIRQNAA